MPREAHINVLAIRTGEGAHNKVKEELVDYVFNAAMSLGGGCPWVCYTPPSVNFAA